MIAWLPTANKTPLPSSPLIAESPEANGQDCLCSLGRNRPSPVSPEQALEFLCACMGKQTLAPGIIIGKDLEFWASAARFAGSLAARQQFLPGLAKDHETYTARWKPVFSGDDRQRLDRFGESHAGSFPRPRSLGEECRPSPRRSFLPDLPFPFSPNSLRNRPIVSSARRRPISIPGGTYKDPAYYPSLHDQWIAALRLPHGQMEGDESDLARLDSQIRDWQRPVTAAVVTPFRLCFRLEEPAETTGSKGAIRERIRTPGMSAICFRTFMTQASFFRLPRPGRAESRRKPQRRKKTYLLSSAMASSRRNISFYPWARHPASARASKAA